MNLPRIATINEATLPEKAVFVGAIGFEDRSLVALQMLQSKAIDVAEAFLISYDPPSGNNRTAETINLARELTGSDPYPHSFERFKADAFLGIERLWARVEESGRDIIVDITGMSRFLILAVLWAAREHRGRVCLLYYRAGGYHPTESEFRASRNNQSAEDPVESFLITGGAPRVLSSPWLSSVRFEEAPVLLVAFPTFDAELLRAPIEEMTPQSLYLLEPGTDTPDWWLAAVREINQSVYHSKGFLERHVVSVQTFGYEETLALLERVYSEYALSHRIVVSPTGSKLQALATFFFKVRHPDVEIIYPAPMIHKPNITEGAGMGFVLDFPNFSALVQNEKRRRTRTVTDLLAAFSERRGQSRES